MMFVFGFACGAALVAGFTYFAARSKSAPSSIDYNAAINAGQFGQWLNADKEQRPS